MTALLLENYLARGWKPIPLHHVTDDGVCSCKEGADCGSPGKHPLFAGWRDEVITNSRWFAWWAAHPRAHVGLRTGSASGFWVLDIDPKHEGDLRLAELEEAHGELPPTRTHRTPSGGSHLLWALPEGVTITNAKGLLPRGLDVRGEGGQIAAPWSAGYQVLLEDVEPRLAPAWLLELIGTEKDAGTSSRADLDADAAAGVGSGDWTPQELEAYCVEILDREVAQLLDGGDERGERNNRLNDAVFTVATLVSCEGAPQELGQWIIDAFEGAGEALGLGKAEVRKTVRSAGRAGRAKPRDPWPPVRIAQRPTVVDLARELGLGADDVVESSMKGRAVARHQTDLGNGQRLIDYFGDRVRWLIERKKWAVYDGKRWKVSDEKARRYAQLTVGLAEMHEAAKYSDELPTPAPEELDDEGEVKPKRGRPRKQTEATDRERFLVWIRKQEMSGRLDAMLKEASAQEGISVSATAFDRSPMLLNCPNGTVELDQVRDDGSALLREHRPGDLMMQMTSVDYLPEAVAPGWELFLKEMQPDEGIRRALQQAAGYSITGDVGEQVMFVHFGVGANGKSVFAETVADVLADMAQETPRETFASGGADRHPTEVARMIGKRFVTTTEPKTGTRLNEDMIKQLTGGGRVAAHFMREDDIEFRPTAKIHYITNHKPPVSDDGATWRRVRLFAWSVVRAREEWIKNLSGVLVRDEGPGVLAWLVRGCGMWQLHGIEFTPEQQQTVDEWRDEEDAFGAWLAERTIAAPGVFTPVVDLFEGWSGWCQRQGMSPAYIGNAPLLGRRLVERGFERKRKAHNTIRGFLGLSLRMGAAPDTEWLEEAGIVPPVAGGSGGAVAADGDDPANW